MKAYRTDDNDIRLFRPNLNVQRMQRTGNILTLPVRIPDNKRNKPIFDNDIVELTLISNSPSCYVIASRW